MKEKLIVLFLASASFIGLNAQVKGQALGVRLGYGGEVSYQHPLNSQNRIEGDLGFYYDHGFNLAGVYQWVFDLSELSPGFNWYVGLGPQIGSWHNQDNKDYDGLALGIVGQIGIEFNFNIPLQLSLDYRPGWYVLPSSYGGAWDGIALGVRYNF